MWEHRRQHSKMFSLATVPLSKCIFRNNTGKNPAQCISRLPTELFVSVERRPQSPQQSGFSHQENLQFSSAKSQLVISSNTGKLIPFVF